MQHNLQKTVVCFSVGCNSMVWFWCELNKKFTSSIQKGNFNVPAVVLANFTKKNLYIFATFLRFFIFSLTLTLPGSIIYTFAFLLFQFGYSPNDVWGGLVQLHFIEPVLNLRLTSFQCLLVFGIVLFWFCMKKLRPLGILKQKDLIVSAVDITLILTLWHRCSMWSNKQNEHHHHLHHRQQCY